VLDTVTSIRADAGEGSRGVAGACAALVSSGGHSAVTMQRGLFQSSISASHASGSIMAPATTSRTAWGSYRRPAPRSWLPDRGDERLHERGAAELGKRCIRSLFGVSSYCNGTPPKRSSCGSALLGGSHEEHKKTIPDPDRVVAPHGACEQRVMGTNKTRSVRRRALRERRRRSARGFVGHPKGAVERMPLRGQTDAP
jgi:hypothetical protein